MSDGTLAPDRKRRIAGRARTLRERLDAPAEGGPAVEDPEEWLAEWRDRVADGDPAAFRRRLDHLGVSESEARAAVSNHGWPEGEQLPGWVDELESVAADVTAADRGEASAAAPENVPFVDLLAPVVSYAREQIDPSVAPAEVPPVADAMEPWLYKRLARLSAHPLFVEFKTYVAHHDRELALAEDPDPPEDDRRHYRGFVDAMLGDGFVRFVEEYALLARLLVTTVRQWVSAVEEFSARLAADRESLREWLGDGDLGAVEAVEATGDRHEDGRAVLAVTFESGARVAYKPRPLDVEGAFYDLLDWLAERTDLPAIDRPAVLAREEYGWLEWVEPDQCSDRAAAERYYRRAGVLLGVLYALRFTDGHLENLVAAGEHPVVVDVETLAHPELPDDRLPHDATPALRESVLRTSLLPVHRPDSDRADLSGFGSDELPAEGEQREFTAVNTDLMDMESVEGDAETFENLPRVDGETVAADECFESLRAGLRAAHDALESNREALLAEGGPLAAFEDSEVRVIYRATRTYGTVLSSLTTPEYLRTGLKVGCKLEALARPQATEAVDAPWSVHDHERAALERLDVPRLTMSTTGTTLRGPADPVAEFATLSPRAAVEQRLRALDATDRREQCRYVDLAFGELSGGGADHADVTGGRPVGDPTPLSDADARRAARRAFDRVSAAAVDDGGAPAWCVPSAHRDGGVLIEWMDESLYGGRLGVAVFAAGVAATADGSVADDAAALAADAAAEVRNSVADDDAHESLGITGVGGLVYGFGVLDDLLDGDYLTDARRAAAAVTDERVASDDHYGVTDGAAGAALALVALHDRTGDGDALDRAVACGEHLLADRSGGRWPLGTDDRPLTGFGHGAGGVGYALARLAEATGEDRFREGALDAVAFEDGHYDAGAGEWADLRAHAGKTVDGWCNGRTGIGLVRLGTLTALPAGPVRRDVERALSEAPTDRMPPYDHACCGTASWIELFLRAGRQLDAPRYERRARRLAGAVVSGGDEWALRSGTRTRPDPTLFRGLGGIGYALLRVSNPDLPSTLLFE
ncbi:type 2 lanthipeptide synthetase LanM family protein [Halorussus limi]|uniref:Type 2 lanthipeptide synthetase LanM family protein n=1 Tax=Halorussus limi TaxID=2938695 RepID=A0A8U0HXJ6_9EURY|nr:type 2 lanthipeptide synthetase LanM family protein [Halorussus limi]UPV75810.1 type 2 lanthipeptide synthetase LanM family protein [Halorussus limi]